jgi:hypothetical protein
VDHIGLHLRERIGGIDGRRGTAVSSQVGREHPMVGGERADDLVPHGVVPAEAVKEKDGRPAPLLADVEFHRNGFAFGHGAAAGRHI